MKSDKVLECPCCQGLKIVCNGEKKSGRHNYLCKQCGRRFQDSYVYAACQPQNRKQALRCLCRGSGVRDCSIISKLSCGAAVLRLIKKEAAVVTVKPRNGTTNRCRQTNSGVMWAGKKRRSGCYMLTQWTKMRL